nr:reverse transcriptase domain-containing protein [Tanacetum cinerariifolium]
MRTRSSSSNLVGESSPNPTSSNPKCRNRRCSKQHFILKESPVDTMADQRTMAELLRAPTEGYVEVIVVPSILAENFELKHSLINMMTSDQFFGLEKDNPHDHIRMGSIQNLLRACPHHGFTKLHQLDTFYNALNPADEDSLNSATGGNLLERRTQDVLTIIENKSKVRNSRNKSIVSQVKSSDAPPPAFVKAVEEICVTCGGAHLYYQCLSADGNTFLEFWDNIQGYVSAAVVNYSQGNSGYRPPSVANQIRPLGFAQPNVQNNQNWFSQPQGYNRGNNFNQDSSYQAPIQQNQVVPLSELEKIKKMHEINIKAMQTQINNVKNELRNDMKTSIKASMSNKTNELKNMMASFFQMNTASTLGSKPLPRNTIANPKALMSNKEKLLELANTPLNENYSAVILKKLPKKLGDPWKFLILCGFSKLKCKALADLGASINLMPLSVWKKLGRPFLRTARTLIDVYGEEMILLDGDERLTLNMRHDTSSYSKQPQKESINMINIYDDSCEDYLEDFFATNHQSSNPTFSFHPDLTSPEVKDDIFDLDGDIVLIEKLLNIDSTKDLPLSHNINPLSGSTTSFSPDHLLEEFADELALTPGNNDLLFDIESNLIEIEYLLNHDPTKEMDSILEDSVDEGNLVDTIPEMFTDEHTLDYSSPPLYDEYDDDLVELEFNNDDAYDDLFDSKEDKIKESKLLIDEHDSSRSSDFLPSPEYDSFLFEDFFEVDALPSTNNEDKVFNPGILIHENLSEVIVQIAPDKNVKKISISHASLILEDFNPPLYELPFYKEVPGSETLLLFSSKNEEIFFKPGILTSKGVHTSLLLELSHQGPKAFKVIKICESPMDIFPCSYG